MTRFVIYFRLASNVDRDYLRQGRQNSRFSDRRVEKRRFDKTRAYPMNSERGTRPIDFSGPKQTIRRAFGIITIVGVAPTLGRYNGTAPYRKSLSEAFCGRFIKRFTTRTYPQPSPHSTISVYRIFYASARIDKTNNGSRMAKTGNKQQPVRRLVEATAI